MFKFKRILAVAALAMLAACGGGGSSGGGGTGGGGGGTANRPPSFSGSTSFTFVEQAFNDPPRVIVQLAASDPDGDPITFGIQGSKDGGLFSFVGAPGALAFQQPPSFETPRDANGDNIYEVDVTASDGTNTVTRTLSIQVTNSLEGLSITQVATGLGQGRALQYLDATNELLVVNDQGRIFVLDAATGNIRSSTLAGLTAFSEVLAIAVDSLAFRDGNFFMLIREQSFLFLLYVNVADGSRTILWGAQPGGVPDGSLNIVGNVAMVGVSDGGNAAAAQDPNDIRGNILAMDPSGDPADPANFSVTARTAAWGLRAPLLPMAEGMRGTSVIDRGANFNEYNEANFALNQRNANFEWPLRDAFANLSFNGAVTGTRIEPRFAQELGSRGAGRWISAASGLQANAWLSLVLLGDDNGNIWTASRFDGPGLELRNLDFRTAGLGSEPIVAMDDGDVNVGIRNRIWMLDRAGTVYVADVQR